MGYVYKDVSNLSKEQKVFEDFITLLSYCSTKGSELGYLNKTGSLFNIPTAIREILTISLKSYIRYDFTETKIAGATSGVFYNTMPDTYSISDIVDVLYKDSELLKHRRLDIKIKTSLGKTCYSVVIIDAVSATLYHEIFIV